MQNRLSVPKPADFLCILPGAVAATFMIGNDAMEWAPWAAALFTLRFVRRTPAAHGLALGACAWALAYVAGWQGVLPFKGWLSYAVPAAAGFAAFSPFIADRLLSPRLGRSVRWLVLPTAWVAVEFAFSHLGYGTWGAVAYSQMGLLPLLQTVAVVGLAGPAFLIGAFGSIANEVWQSPRRGWPLAAAFAAAVALLLGGGWLLLRSPEPRAKVQVAGIVVDNMPVFRNTWGPLSYGRPLDPEAAERVRPSARALVQSLFDRSEQAADRGARIIVWSEANALIFASDEADMIHLGQSFAARRGVYLFMAAAVMTPGEPLAENVIIVIDDRGRVVDRYLKSHPTPGEMSVRGDGRVRTLSTPYGRLAWAICYDFDYPGLIRQAGQAGADILIDPSWEHAGMAPLHSEMAAMRAIETGAGLFRPVNGGMGLAVDGRGRVISALPASRSLDEDLIADMPIARTWAPQVAVGDAFAWACATLLMILAIRATRAGRTRDQQSEA